MSRTERAHAPHIRTRVPFAARDLRPSVRRAMQSANGSSLDDVPTPAEIDPSLLVDPNTCDLIDCDRCGYLDLFGAVRAL